MSTPARHPVRDRVERYLAPLLLLGALAAAWEVAPGLLGTPRWMLPTPTDIARAAVEVRDVLPGHVRTTMVEAMLGLAAAAAGGLGVAMAIASSTLVRRLLYPLLVVSQNVPLIVLAPLLAVWFGFGMLPKVLIVALVGFFPIAIATAEALLHADAEVIDLLRTMGASRWQVLRIVRLPGAIPGFFAGLRISATYAIFGAVIGEWVGARAGLGLFITRSQTGYRTDRVFVAVIVIAAISIALFALVQLAARLAMPWRAGTEQESL